jgi:hypothetical protein
MYVVFCYYNYRKNVSFNILKTFKSLKKADKYALSLAESLYNNVVEGVLKKYVFVEGQVIKEYTAHEGYDSNVYTVIKIAEPEENEEDDEENEENEKEKEDEDEKENEKENEKETEKEDEKEDEKENEKQ